MYGIFGAAFSIQNIYKLSANFIKDKNIQTTNDLKPCYLDFIQKYYNNPPINRSEGLIVQDQTLAKKLVEFFSASEINDLYQEKMVGDLYEIQEQERNSQFAEENLMFLHELNKEYFELFRLAIHSIALSHANTNQAGMSAHGGSSSKLIGLIWLSLKHTLSAQDLLEMYIHELSHTLVFIDEINFGHFNYDNISKKAYWATSSILNRERPMDKVVHSIVVSTEVLHARQTYLPNKDKLTVHPDTQKMKKNTLAAIDSVLSHPYLDDVCLPRSVELAKKAREHVLNC